MITLIINDSGAVTCIGQTGLLQPPALANSFTAKLLAGVSDLCLTIIGDSTGNDLTEWPYLLTKAFSAKAQSSYFIDYKLWNPIGGVYSSPILLNRISDNFMSETFDRADGLVGTASSNGENWNANSWTISNKQGIPDAPSHLLVPSTQIGSTSFKVSVDIKFSSSGGDYRIYCVSDSGLSRYLMVDIRAINTMEMIVRDGTTSTTLATYSPLGLIDGNIYTLTIVKDGLNIYASINNAWVSATLSQAQESSLTGRSVQFGLVNSIAGGAFDNIFIGNISKPPHKLEIFNSSIPGYNLAEQLIILNQSVPSLPDLVLISDSHNETSTDGQFIGDYVSFVSAIRNLYPGIPVCAVGENPRTDSNAAVHAARVAALQKSSPYLGYDYIDGYSAFLVSPLGLSALLQADGIHPNASGSQVWANAAVARFGL